MGAVKFLLKYLAAVPKSPPTTSEFSRLEYPNQPVTRVSRKIPWNDTKSTQKTEPETEHKRKNYR
jgi:hypothetical protein